MNMDKDDGALTAVALRYDGENAPTVTAKGTGDLARRIIEIARDHEVPLFENAHLVKLLAVLDLDAEIPQALYVAVADIIAFAYWLNEKVPEKKL